MKAKLILPVNNAPNRWSNGIGRLFERSVESLSVVIPHRALICIVEPLFLSRFVRDRQDRRRNQCRWNSRWKRRIELQRMLFFLRSKTIWFSYRSHLIPDPGYCQSVVRRAIVALYGVCRETVGLTIRINRESGFCVLRYSERTIRNNETHISCAEIGKHPVLMRKQ
jgi:hypothetical protein